MCVLDRVPVKEQHVHFMVITSANLNWFSKSFHWQLHKETLHVNVTRFCNTHQTCLSTTLWNPKFQLCQFQQLLCTWEHRVHLAAYVVKYMCLAALTQSVCTFQWRYCSRSVPCGNAVSAGNCMHNTSHQTYATNVFYSCDVLCF